MWQKLERPRSLAEELGDTGRADRPHRGGLSVRELPIDGGGRFPSERVWAALRGELGAGYSTLMSVPAQELNGDRSVVLHTSY
jgi:hypothetical protein